MFRDISAGDFRLSAGSPGFDFAPATTTYTRDRSLRVFDMTSKPDVFGSQDLGAYEYVSNPIFADGFEPVGI